MGRNIRPFITPSTHPLADAYGTFLRKRNTTKQKRIIKFKQFLRFTEKNLICVPRCTPCLRGNFFQNFLHDLPLCSAEL